MALNINHIDYQKSLKVHMGLGHSVFIETKGTYIYPIIWKEGEGFIQSMDGEFVDDGSDELICDTCSRPNEPFVLVYEYLQWE